MAQLRIAPGEANERLLDVSELSSADYAKTHTGISDYRVTAPYDQSLEDEALEEVFLERDDGTLLFRGLIESVSTDERGASTTVAGPGPAYKLESSEVVFQVSNQLAHNAISDFWNNETVFSPTVTTPTVEFSTTGETAWSATTNAEFSDRVEFADTTPLLVQNNNIELLQSCFFQEGEDADASNTGFDDGSTDTEISGGSYAPLSRDEAAGGPDFLEFNFTLDYTIPAEDFEPYIRDAGDGDGVPELTWELQHENGATYTLDVNDNLGAGVVDDFDWNPLPFFAASQPEPYPDLTPGDYTLRVEITNTDGVANQYYYYIDCVAPLDGRYTYTFDETTDANDALAGPELYPDAVDVPIDGNAVSWNVTEATANATFNDTTNNQRLQLRLGNQTYFPNDGTEDNTSSVTTAFGSEVGNVINARVTLGRYGTGATTSPSEGFNGQVLNDITVTFDGNDIPVIQDETFEGNQLEVAQDLHTRADMRYVVEHSKTSLPVYSFRAGDETRTLPATVTADENNRTTRSDFGEYFNDVTVRGQTEGGTRLTASVEDSSEISTYGRRHFDAVDPSLKTEAQLEAAARALLLEKLRERDKKGRIRHPPVDVMPGFSYSNPFGSGTIPIEEVRYRISNGEIEGESVFDFRTDLQLGESFGGLRRSDRNTKLGF